MFALPVPRPARCRRPGKEARYAPFCILLAALIAVPAFAGSGGGPGCQNVALIDSQIECWQDYYNRRYGEPIEVHEMTDAQLSALVDKTPLLDSADRGVWLFFKRHGPVVWLIAADESGRVLQRGKAPLQWLLDVIGHES